MQVRYDDKRIAVREQVTGETVERSEDEGEMSDCIIHEVKRSVRYDIGWYGTRGSPGDNDGPIPELDSTSCVVCRRRMDTGPQVLGEQDSRCQRSVERVLKKPNDYHAQWSLWVQVFFGGRFNQIVTKL